jgi:hypothetical protein
MYFFLGSERDSNSQFIKNRCMVELKNDERTNISDYDLRVIFIVLKKVPFLHLGS